MKTFIATIAAAIILTGSNAFAAEGTAARSKVAAINNTLDQYTAALANGKVDNVEKLFTEQFHQRYATGKNPHIFDKDQIVGFLKQHKNIHQQCATEYSIVDENEGVAIAKVEMEYENGTRVDYVTINQNGDNYQISQIVTTWK